MSERTVGGVGGKLRRETWNCPSDRKHAMCEDKILPTIAHDSVTTCYFLISRWAKFRRAYK